MAAEHPHIIVLPPWLRMPSRYQQHWIRYTLLGLAAGYSSLFLIRYASCASREVVHSELCIHVSPTQPLMYVRCLHSNVPCLKCDQKTRHAAN